MPEGFWSRLFGLPSAKVSRHFHGWSEHRIDRPTRRKYRKAARVARRITRKHSLV